MSYIKFFERLSVPDFSSEMTGIVEVDQERCKCCSLCIHACPATALEEVGKKARMVTGAECFACADCVAICPEDAITLVRPLVMKGFFKPIHRGELKGPRLKLEF